jgi:hypothetical protein
MSVMSRGRLSHLLRLSRRPRALSVDAALPEGAVACPLPADASLVGAVRRGGADTSSTALPPAPAVAVYPEAVDEAEEARLVRDAERWLRRRAYEGGHFDRVIAGCAR